ncbi:MAG: tRNA epoxyqueuosine(34) reductase QueG [Bryobacterales bacterium]|nr:tRNA epoxyqueuosine(34) reductase QueG [Bryobacterales bacterium]
MECERVRQWAAREGFGLCGIAAAEALSDITWFHEWVALGYAGEMGYLTDHRAELRRDPRALLSSAKSIVCVGMFYNSAQPHTAEVLGGDGRGWISRYAWGDDYHTVIRERLERVAAQMRTEWGDFDYRICVDTAPLLERSLGRLAGLGWIGKNTCLINQQKGSWFFLGEMLTSLPLAPDVPAADRCGTCRRCIDACPTDAIVPRPDGGWTIDSRRCISYLTIEKRGPVPEKRGPVPDFVMQKTALVTRKTGPVPDIGVGTHVFGCDICQDVCPWNRRAGTDCDEAFEAREGMVGPDLEMLAKVTEEEFRTMFRNSPVVRTKYRGFLRNVAVAMGNAGLERFRPALERLARWEDPVVAEAAKWALGRIGEPVKLALGVSG